jgi:hypothetical protein
MAATADEKPAVVSLSDTEKDLGPTKFDRLGGFEDPDAGLSEEERAKIVRAAPKEDMPAFYTSALSFSSFYHLSHPLIAPWCVS